MGIRDRLHSGTTGVCRRRSPVEIVVAPVAPYSGPAGGGRPKAAAPSPGPAALGRKLWQLTVSDGPPGAFPGGRVTARHFAGRETSGHFPTHSWTDKVLGVTFNDPTSPIFAPGIGTFLGLHLRAPFMGEGA